MVRVLDIVVCLSLVNEVVAPLQQRSKVGEEVRSCAVSNIGHRCLNLEYKAGCTGVKPEKARSHSEAVRFMSLYYRF